MHIEEANPGNLSFVQVDINGPLENVNTRLVALIGLLTVLANLSSRTSLTTSLLNCRFKDGGFLQLIISNLYFRAYMSLKKPLG